VSPMPYVPLGVALPVLTPRGSEMHSPTAYRAFELRDTSPASVVRRSTSPMAGRRGPTDVSRLPTSAVATARIDVSRMHARLVSMVDQESPLFMYCEELIDQASEFATAIYEKDFTINELQIRVLSLEDRLNSAGVHLGSKDAALIALEQRKGLDNAAFMAEISGTHQTVTDLHERAAIAEKAVYQQRRRAELAEAQLAETQAFLRAAEERSRILEDKLVASAERTEVYIQDHAVVRRQLADANAALQKSEENVHHHRTSAAREKANGAEMSRLLGAERDQRTLLESEADKLKGRLDGRAMQAMQMMIRKMKNLPLIAPFQTWAEAMAEGRDHRAKMRKVGLRFFRRSLGMCLNKWSETIIVQRQHKLRIRKALGHWFNRTLTMGWELWVGHVATQKRLKLAAARVVGRWTNQTLCGAFEQWSANAKELKKSKVVGSRVLLRWLNALLATSLDRWRTEVKERKELQRKVRQSLGKWLNATISNAMATWKETVAHSNKVRGTASKVMARMMNMAVSNTFTLWSTNVSETLDARDKIRRVLGLMANRLLALGFITWRDHKLGEQAMQQRGRQVVLRMLQRSLTMAFQGFVTVVEESQRQHKVCGNLLKRWMHQSLLAGWNGFKEGVAHSQHVHAVVRKLGLHWAHKGLIAGFNAWLSMHLKTQHNLMVVGQVLARLQNLPVARSIKAWQLHCSTASALRSIKTGVIDRWMNKALSNSFNSWSTNVYHIRRVARTAGKAMRKLRNLGISRAFNMWRSNITHVRKSLWVMVKMDKRLNVKQLKRALHMWRLTTAENVYWMFHDLKACKSSVAKIKATYWKLWSHEVGREAAHRRTAMKIVLRWQNMTLSEAFGKWNETVRSTKDNRTKHLTVHKNIIRWHSLASRSCMMLVQVEAQALCDSMTAAIIDGQDQVPVSNDPDVKRSEEAARSRFFGIDMDEALAPGGSDGPPVEYPTFSPPEASAPSASPRFASHAPSAAARAAAAGVPAPRAMRPASLTSPRGVTGSPRGVAPIGQGSLVPGRVQGMAPYQTMAPAAYSTSPQYNAGSSPQHRIPGLSSYATTPRNANDAQAYGVAPPLTSPRQSPRGPYGV